MSPKTEQMVNCLQEIQKFAGDRGQQDPSFATEARKFGSLTKKLKSQKLLFQIVSQSPPLAYAVAKLTSKSCTLPALYQFQTATLPDEHQRTEIPISQVEYQRTELAAPEAVILQFTNSSSQEPISHSLPKGGKLLVGRRPDCQIQIPNEYGFVSGHHAEIVPAANANPSGSWQICDTSSNGTYVNGQRIEGCHTLQPDDRIVLGYREPTDRSPELIFKFEYNIAAPKTQPSSSPAKPKTDPNEELYQQLVDCEVLCLAIDPTQPLSNAQKRIIELGQEARLFKIIAIVDLSAGDRNPELAQSNIDALQGWLKEQNFDRVVARPLLPLAPFYPSTDPNADIDPKAQQEFDRFLQFLEQSAAGKVEDILLQRVAGKAKFGLATIERTYADKEAALKQQLQERGALLQGIGLEELDGQIRKAFKQVAENKERSLREIRLELTKSKASLVDGFNKESLVYKIKKFTDELKPVVTEEEGQTSLRLTADVLGEKQSIHSYLNRLYYGDMAKWAKEEWERVRGSYAGGGLQGLYDRARDSLSIVPCLELPSSSFQASSEFDVYKCLQYSFVEFDSEVSYQSSPEGNKLVLLGSAVMGLVGVAMGNPFVLMGVLGRQAAQQQSKSSKTDHIADNLRKGLCNHYQSLAKSIAEKLAHQINLEIEAEERRFKTAIEAASEQISNYMKESKKGLIDCDRQEQELQKQKNKLRGFAKRL